MLSTCTLPFNEFISKEVIKDFLFDVVNNMDISNDENTWYNSMKAIGEKHNFTSDKKLYKENPIKYNVWYADCVSFLRIAITTTQISAKLFNPIKILGLDKIKRRVDLVIKKKGN